MEQLLLAALLIGVLGCAALVVLVVVVVRTVSARAGTLAGRARMQARALSGGLPGEVARLRRELASIVEAAARALAAARAAEVPLGDAPGLVHRLRLAARDTDTELRLIDTVPDLDRAGALLGSARVRVGEVRAAAADLTDGLARAAGECVGALEDLRRDCAAEADALRTGTRVAHRPA